jgi:hypothetical protein
MNRAATRQAIDMACSVRRTRPAHGAAGWLALGLAALAIAGCGGSSSATPTGSYATNIPETHTPIGKVLSGTWTVTFGKSGSYTIQQNSEFGLSVGKGSYVRGTSFVIKTELPNTCGPGIGTGIYKLKLSGKTLRFLRVKDPCSVRRTVLAQTFTKVR